MKTDKYNSAISAIQCDLSLAKNGRRKLSTLDDRLKKQESDLIRDISLLEELEFLLRTGNAEIHVKTS